jgi:hypothetical protein
MRWEYQSMISRGLRMMLYLQMITKILHMCHIPEVNLQMYIVILYIHLKKQTETNSTLHEKNQIMLSIGYMYIYIQNTFLLHLHSKINK